MSLPWMPLDVAAYRKDTAHLAAAEHGAYLLLIMHYWATGALPDDDRQLARIAAMTPGEWRRSRAVLQAFFHDGWKHTRIDKELARAAEISSKRSAAAKQKHSNSSANASANAQQMDTHARTCAGALPPQPQLPEVNSELRSGADAPRDIRGDLFGSGLKKLAAMTGKTPDSCRSLVGKWLKSVNDEAIHVLAAIEDAERNRIADPVGWINKALQPRMTGNGKRTVQQAATDLAERVRAFGDPAPDRIRDGTGQADVRLLSAR